MSEAKMFFYMPGCRPPEAVDDDSLVEFTSYVPNIVKEHIPITPEMEEENINICLAEIERHLSEGNECEIVYNEGELPVIRVKKQRGKVTSADQKIEYLQVKADCIIKYPDRRDEQLQYLETVLGNEGNRQLIEWNTSKQYKYKEYLRSYDWKKLVDEVRYRDKWCCTECKGKKKLHTHHLTYARRYDEDLDDLITLCEICHSKVHGFKIRTQRKRKYRRRKT